MRECVIGDYHLKKYSITEIDVTALKNRPDRIPKTTAGQTAAFAFV